MSRAALLVQWTRIETTGRLTRAETYVSTKLAIYRKGDVVLVSFPYTTDDGQTQTKRRPAVIISNDNNNARLDDVLLVPLTSNTSRATREPTQVVILEKSEEAK